jgi:hypothetical protein
LESGFDQQLPLALWHGVLVLRIPFERVRSLAAFHQDAVLRVGHESRDRQGTQLQRRQDPVTVPVGYSWTLQALDQEMIVQEGLQGRIADYREVIRQVLQ